MMTNEIEGEPMDLRILSAICALTLSCSFGIAATSPTKSGTEEMTMVFKGAEVTDVAAALGKKMNKNFIIDPQVRGTITIINAHPVSQEEAYNEFNIALAQLGLVA